MLLLGQSLDAGTLKGRVTAAIERQLLLFEVNDLIDHGIEEVAVVGNQQQRTGIALEPLFQPEDGVEIKVVGGLIEQQQVGRTH